MRNGLHNASDTILQGQTIWISENCKNIFDTFVDLHNADAPTLAVHGRNLTQFADREDFVDWEIFHSWRRLSEAENVTAINGCAAVSQ
ncbi:hypothetical protein EVAR_54444_1 [Eumeta japonica]|uniref:Uncharacterized protein n=1 Tax=Eumeta variegata TaxID=151549 RepID=A0A4C1XN22_EUMVA|nr:hypothetical protein EVAR_54444_1 [Eumeta japonica]